MHVPFLSQSGPKRLGRRLRRTTMNLCRTLRQKRDVGGCCTVGIYSALYGTTKSYDSTEICCLIAHVSVMFVFHVKFTNQFDDRFMIAGPARF